MIGLLLRRACGRLRRFLVALVGVARLVVVRLFPSFARESRAMLVAWREKTCVGLSRSLCCARVGQHGLRLPKARA